jgi:C4-dicarboxylate-specific signal transduction histidine kinase
MSDSRGAVAVTTDLRASGIDVVGDIVWGTHFCLFYEAKADLLDTLVAYCKAGLESHEYCLWVVAAPITSEEAREALRRVVHDLDRYFALGAIDIVSAHDWYLQDGTFDLERVIGGWHEKLAQASARGYAGTRVTGDTAWLEKKDWKDFCEYEDSLNDAIAGRRLAVLCTYPLAACGASEILDVVRTHQFAIVRRGGNWDVIETAGYKQAKAEIKRLNEELEQRVIERTGQLMAVNDELIREVRERQRAEERAEEERERLRQARSDLAHMSRVTTIGELAASLAHEIKQPISAAIADARTCVRWIEREPPDISEARAAATRVVKGATRAADIVSRVGALFKKGTSAIEAVDLNELIRDMVVLLRSEATRHAIGIRTVLASELPAARADAVQIQQVLMNLMLNGIDAMKTIEGTRELTITSQQTAPDQMLITVTDTGIGVPRERLTQIFDAFFTTKPDGIGMGLPISRSIIESHGGRLWVEGENDAGTSFHFVMPAAGVVRTGSQETLGSPTS